MSAVSRTLLVFDTVFEKMKNTLHVQDVAASTRRVWDRRVRSSRKTVGLLHLHHWAFMIEISELVSVLPSQANKPRW